MKILKRYFLGCVLLGLLQSSLAEGLTLEQAMRAALDQNPELLAVRRKIEAAAGRAIQARLWPNPELEFSSEEVRPAGGFSSAQNLVGVSQTAPFPGKKSLDSKIGRKEMSAAEWEYLGREIETERDVKTAFAAALAAEKKVAISTELLDLARDIAETAAKRVAAGVAAPQERLRAEIEFERASVALADARRDSLEAQEALAALMGRPGEPVGPLAGELRETAELPELSQARERMLREHPLVRAAMAVRERSELELRRARLEAMPDATVGVAGGRDFGEEEQLMAFRVSLPLPLFDRGQGRKREARAESEIASFDLTAVRQRLIRELSVADARLRAAAGQIEAYSARILPRAEEALRLTRGGYEAGKFGLLDLLDVQRALAESRLDYYEKLAELNAAQAELDALSPKEPRSSQPAGRPEPESESKQ